MSLAQTRGGQCLVLFIKDMKQTTMLAVKQDTIIQERRRQPKNVYKRERFIQEKSWRISLAHRRPAHLGKKSSTASGTSMR